MTISTWSPSRIVDFEKCKLVAWLKYDQKIPEPERPLPPGKTEHANDRGSRIHDGLEQHVQGNGPMPTEAGKFTDEVAKLCEMYAAGMVSLEGEWGMDRGWNPVGWNGEWQATDEPFVPTLKAKKLPERGLPDEYVLVGRQLYKWEPVWLRLKLDALVHLSRTEAVVIDYKSGKKFGNEIKHGEQLLIYQLCAFLRYPELETVHTELWYLDADELTSRTFTRDQGLRFKRSIEAKGIALTTCTDFKPNPNKYSCQWCRYGTKNGGSGHCTVGV